MNENEKILRENMKDLLEILDAGKKALESIDKRLKTIAQNLEYLNN